VKKAIIVLTPLATSLAAPAVALILAVASIASHAQSLAYEPAVVKIKGTLTSAPGESPNGKAVTFPALKLASPVIVQGTSTDAPTEKGVMLMHMVLDAKTMASFKALKGKPVEVTGTLFHSDNGNHQTNVLITPTAIAAR
jgi:hypothetical protein